MFERYFASSYIEAREMFLAAAGAAGASLSSVRAPGSGPGGETLFMDVATVGDPGASKRFVVSSGLHGVEGYCGSACQIGLLRSHATIDRLPSDIVLILIHALNPFGFAWVRRFNEDNVDLNRNFLADFSAPPANPRYDDVREALAADPTDAAAWAAAERALTDYRARSGEAAFVEAVSGGQYVDPAGIFYGGEKPCWTQLALIDLLKRLLSGAEMAILFDIHTGIGEFGERVAFCQTVDEDPRKEVAARLFGEPVRTPAKGPGGGRARRGLMLPYLDTLGLAPWFLPIGVEFGTYAMAETAVATRAENWLFNRGDRTSRVGRRIVATLREAFSPTDIDWELAVATKSSEMFRRLLMGFTAIAPKK